MSSTVLSISQDVAAVIGVAPITSLVGSSEPHARAMRVLANTAGRELQQMRNEDGQGWIVLTREHEFETVVGQDAYAFPEDFDQIVDGTVWDRDSYRIARGPLSPQQWQNVKSGLIETTRISPNYRIRSTAQGVRQFWVDPTPGEIETLVIEYVSTHWVMSAQGERRESIQHDSDTTLFLAAACRVRARRIPPLGPRCRHENHHDWRSPWTRPVPPRSDPGTDPRRLTTHECRQFPSRP